MGLFMRRIWKVLGAYFVTYTQVPYVIGFDIKAGPTLEAIDWCAIYNGVFIATCLPDSLYGPLYMDLFIWTSLYGPIHETYLEGPRGLFHRDPFAGTYL